jgi:hypothetical protein
VEKGREERVSNLKVKGMLVPVLRLEGVKVVSFGK